jgi:hypothetical protein
VRGSLRLPEITKSVGFVGWEQVLQAMEDRELATLGKADHKAAVNRLKAISGILQARMLELEPTLLLFNSL